MPNLMCSISPDHNASFLTICISSRPSLICSTEILAASSSYFTSIISSDRFIEQSSQKLKLEFEGFDRELHCFLMWIGTENCMLDCFSQSMSYSFILFAEYFQLKDHRWDELLPWVAIDLTSTKKQQRQPAELYITRHYVSFNTLEKLIKIQTIRPDMTGALEAILNWLDEASCSSREQVIEMQSSADFFKVRQLLSQLKDWLPLTLRDFTNLVRKFRHASAAFDYSEILPTLKVELDGTPRSRLFR